MTPQASVMYAAPLRPGAAAVVHQLLCGMNKKPGVYDPQNDLIPLHTFPQLHFARLLVVQDLANADRAVYGLPTTGLPEYLVFLAEIDGEESTFRNDLVRVARAGLVKLFTNCSTYKDGSDLGDWLNASRTDAAATYVNWRGRTVVQVREEETLRRFLKQKLKEDMRADSAENVRLALQATVDRSKAQGELRLTSPIPTPIAWRIQNALNLILVPVVFLLFSPLLLILLPFLILQIRHWEKNDPAIAPPVDPNHSEKLLEMENQDVTNQFNVFGSLKPGRLRLWVVRLLLLFTDYAARHLYHSGNLARVSTIHFARWVFMDGGQRMLFSSIYDGSLESYMDDFINKVGFGLNITFSNGIGYPRTRWLLLDGCQDEQTFKRVLRRHQLPTEVWFNAHPGLTAANKHRNLLIRAGLEKQSMSEKEAAAWLALI
ncbi:hypothetical protein [Terriglobus roseus]|uniref:Peroxidase n=1 Tax=Terriglobus roseus TaxID=392734 RepID=A0A1G7GTU3_9BACT|nr:hypothetical protein [Terriglobus roseus]SDE91598.1 hypothetical protein SAMN05444167_0801 [Terriglobus roseus]